MRELNPRAWIPSLDRYATGFDDLYYHRQMNGVGEWWCYPAGEDDQVDVEIELPTGLKDKNGQKIYEGDIVKYGDGDAYEVCFFNGCFGIKNRNLSVLYSSYTFNDNDLYGSTGKLKLEVIGNIHENKELLEINDVD